MNQYAPPVDQLLRLGPVQLGKTWRDYLRMGFTREHVPELMRLMTDRELNFDFDFGKLFAECGPTPSPRTASKSAL